MPSPVDTLFAALRAKVGLEVVSHTETPNQLRVLGRILEDGAGVNGNNWKIVKFQLLSAMEGRPWKVDLSKHYFIKKETERLVFAWRILLQGEDVAQHYEEIAALVRTSPSAKPEVSEVPLLEPGYGRPQGGRRGAGPMGSVMVGPMAVQQKMMGG